MNYNPIYKDHNSNYYTPLTPYTPQENNSNERNYATLSYSNYKIYEDLTKSQTNCCSRKCNFCHNKRIWKLNSTTFFFSEFYFLRYLIYYFIVGSLCIPLVYYDQDELNLIIIIISSSILLLLIIISCILFLETYLIFDSNTLKVVKKAICRKKSQHYFFGEIEKIDLDEDEDVYNNENQIEVHNIRFYLFKTSGEKILLFKYHKFDICTKPPVDMNSLNEFLKDINSLIKK